MKTLKNSIVIFIFLICSDSFSQISYEKRNDSELREKAAELAQNLLILDSHLDVPLRLYRNPELNLSKLTNEGHFDYPRAVKGGLNTAFMAVYISPAHEEKGDAKELADSIIYLTNNVYIKYTDQFAHAYSPSDVLKNFNVGKISLPIGIENGSAVEGSLKNLQEFFQKGVRYITLCHSKNNHICDSSFDEEKKWHGLSPFGKEMIEEMNRLGMIIDVSHISDEAFLQVIEISKAPVIASHSSCRYFTPGFERNMSDEMIKLLAQKGGVIQIGFGSFFLDNELRTYNENLDKELNQYFNEKNHERTKEKENEFVKNYNEKNPIKNPDISKLVDHIEHAVKIAGIDHVGFGSDFDGIDKTPDGIDDVTSYPNIIFELLKRGYSESDIEKICSGNFLRVWERVEELSLRENKAQ